MDLVSVLPIGLVHNASCRNGLVVPIASSV